MVKVLHSAFGLTVQDLGRFGYARFGVPNSGSMDQYASKLANKILNNPKDAAVLEITNGGCKLVFETTTSICLTGADYSVKLDDKDLKLNRLVQVEKGSVLSFAKRKYGFRTYLAVKHGFKTQPVLGSRSMYQTITRSFILKKGDRIKIEPDLNYIHSPAAKVRIEMEHFKTKGIDCYQGPEFELLNAFQQKLLKETEFKISVNNTRMGYQLEQCIENTVSQMLTSSVLPGTVQLTPSGRLIILMRDCQVTGGYPRILQLSEQSINRLAQKSTGETIRFKIRPL